MPTCTNCGYKTWWYICTRCGKNMHEEDLQPITAEAIFDIIAPDTRDDASVTVTRESLQAALDKLL